MAILSARHVLKSAAMADCFEIALFVPLVKQLVEELLATNGASLMNNLAVPADSFVDAQEEVH